MSLAATLYLRFLETRRYRMNFSSWTCKRWPGTNYHLPIKIRLSRWPTWQQRSSSSHRSWPSSAALRNLHRQENSKLWMRFSSLTYRVASGRSPHASTSRAWMTCLLHEWEPLWSTTVRSFTSMQVLTPTFQVTFTPISSPSTSSRACGIRSRTSAGSSRETELSLARRSECTTRTPSSSPVAAIH